MPAPPPSASPPVSPPDKEPAIKGVFSTETVTTVGYGTTKRRVTQTITVYAEETPDGRVVCQPLSAQHVPLGPKRSISKDTLFKSFVPAPHIYLERMLPALASLQATVERAENHREEGALFSAEFEFKNALRLDEHHIRASFGLGLTYLDRGEKDGALVVFNRLSRLEGTSAPEYKHLFNEFGIKLRKAGMYTQALSHYAKAMRLSPKDENLCYNLARALYEKGRTGAARRMLERALKLAPGFAEAHRFMEFLREQSFEIIGESTMGAVEDAPAGFDKRGVE